ncbi:MAG: serine hydrolase domain-containing protein [Pseudonocardiaceae bacterium]
MSDVQQQVQNAIDELVESGAERGVQVAAYRHGELVVDAVAGIADPVTGRLVTSDTPFYNFSIGKGVTASVAHVLAEHNVFSYNTPIVELWPAFGAHGKEAVTVRHVLTHSAGVPGVPADTTVEDVCDWQKMCATIADAQLWWEPGTKIGYHAYTFGYIIGELVRRATGKPISQVLLEDVAGPLGIADEMFFGMPESEHGRLARLEDAEGAMEMLTSMPKDHPMFKAGPVELMPTASFGSRTDVLVADIPAGGKMTARAVARMYAALLGEVDGVRLISPERLREVTAVEMSGVDEVFGMPSSWGLGYAVEQAVFGMPGAGGSRAFGDTTTGLAFGLTKNRLSADFSTVDRIAEIVTSTIAKS